MIFFPKRIWSQETCKIWIGKHVLIMFFIFRILLFWHIGGLAGQEETALLGIANKKPTCGHTFHRHTSQSGVHTPNHLRISPALKSTQGQAPGTRQVEIITLPPKPAGLIQTSQSKSFTLPTISCVKPRKAVICLPLASSCPLMVFPLCGPSWPSWHGILSLREL